MSTNIEAEKRISDLTWYYTHKNEQNLNGLKYALRSGVLHEVDEILIALTMDPPDIDIALSMAKRIKEFVNKL